MTNRFATKIEMTDQAKAKQEEYRELYRTFPQQKAFSTWEDILSYIKLGIFLLEAPLIGYYVVRDMRKLRKLRAQVRAAAAN